MSILHLSTKRRAFYDVLSVRHLAAALRRRHAPALHNDLLRAGQPAAHGPALMTVLHGGRPPRH